MKRLIVPIFVMNSGCPNRCVFCNERITAGDFPAMVTRDELNATVERYLAGARKERYDTVQIAFYGGNFTGMTYSSQERLLRYALPYIEKGIVSSIRISTRPDWIDARCLNFLKAHHVRTVEIGAQSLDDEVLALSKRGHTASQVKSAVALLKSGGFETGVHLMAGLPGDSKDRFYRTVSETIAFRPDTVRIHPTLVLRGTILADRYERGLYRTLSLNEAVDWCKDALRRFKAAGILVIRVGLHPTDEMVRGENVIAGPFHPAFRSLVESALFLDMALQLLQHMTPRIKSVCFSISPHDSSYFRGIRNVNIAALETRLPGTSLTVREDPLQKRDTIAMSADGRRYETDCTTA